MLQLFTTFRFLWIYQIKIFKIQIQIAMWYRNQFTQVQSECSNEQALRHKHQLLSHAAIPSQFNVYREKIPFSYKY